MDNDIGPYAGSASSIVLATDDLKVQNSIKLFPNPTKSFIKIIVNEKSNILIFDSKGKKISENYINVGISELKISDFVPGIYYIKVINDKETTSNKIIVN